MRKIIILFIVLVFIAGCGLFNKGQTASISDTDVHVGTEGLTVNFVKDSPPSEVYEGEEFPVYVEVTNKGAADITGAYLSLGFQQDYFSSQVKSKMFDISGKSMGNPNGEQNMFRFLLSAQNIIGESRTVPITVSACYSYNTLATIPVCIEPDVYNMNPVQKGCTVEDISLKGGQGGPVSITKVASKMLLTEGETKAIPQFTIELENNQEGTVVAVNNAQALCSAASLSKDILNKVEFSVGLSEQRLQCNNDVESVMLENNKATIVCRLEEGIDKKTVAYTTLLQVRLDYGYSQSATNNVIIKKRL
jgi:hypothetical protein